MSKHLFLYYINSFSYCIVADDPRMCYSIREQICVGVWPKPKGFESKGFADNLQIKSRCFDASKQNSEATLSIYTIVQCF